MLGFLFAIFSAISFSTNNIFLKKVGIKLNSTQSLILVYIFVSILTFILTFIFGNYSHILNLKILFLIFLTGFFGAIGILSFLKSFENLSISKTLAIASIYPFITLLINFIFFKESILISNLISMLIVFLGILLSLDIKKRNFKFKFNKFLLYPIITAFGWGIYYIFLNLLSKENISNINVLFYSEFSIFLNIFIFYFIFIRKKIKLNFRNIISKSILINSFLAGFFAIIGVLLFIESLKSISSSISASIISSQVIFSSIFAYFLFNEKLNKFQILGIIIVFIGLIIFNLLY